MTEELLVPPHSSEAESAVIGALLLDNEAVDRMGDLKAEAFYIHENRIAFQYTLKLLLAGRPADILTVADAVKEGGEKVDLVYLTQIYGSTPSAANIGRYAEIVRDLALKRGIMAAANKVHDIAVSKGKKAVEMLDAAQAEFAKLAESTVRREPARISEAMTRYLDALDARVHGEAPNPGIPTGLVDLDAMLNGGIRRGALLTIGARPGMGKSALAETIACNASESSYSILFLSQEMPESEVTERAVANWGRVSAQKLASAGRHFSQTDWERITVAATKAADAQLFIDDQPGLTLLDVTTKARGIKRKHGLDLLIVDYLQLMMGSEEKRYQQIEAITKGLKILAKTLNIAVIALSQFSRDIEKRPNPRPKLSDFRDSGSIEQDSDILLGLYRDEQDNPDSAWKGLAELFIMKNRQGKTGKVGLTYIGDFMRFENFTGQMPSDEQRSRRRGFGE